MLCLLSYARVTCRVYILVPRQLHGDELHLLWLEGVASVVYTERRTSPLSSLNVNT